MTNIWQNATYIQKNVALSTFEIFVEVYSKYSKIERDLKPYLGIVAKLRLKCYLLPQYYHLEPSDDKKKYWICHNYKTVTTAANCQHCTISLRQINCCRRTCNLCYYFFYFEAITFMTLSFIARQVRHCFS